MYKTSWTSLIEHVNEYTSARNDEEKRLAKSAVSDSLRDAVAAATSLCWWCVASGTGRPPWLLVITTIGDRDRVTTNEVVFLGDDAYVNGRKLRMDPASVFWRNAPESPTDRFVLEAKRTTTMRCFSPPCFGREYRLLAKETFGGSYRDKLFEIDDIVYEAFDAYLQGGDQDRMRQLAHYCYGHERTFIGTEPQIRTYGTTDFGSYPEFGRTTFAKWKRGYESMHDVAKHLIRWRPDTDWNTTLVDFFGSDVFLGFKQ